ncbi:MAG: hypothetical protein R2748_16145 [Bryobacterales bacterium]
MNQLVVMKAWSAFESFSVTWRHSGIGTLPLAFFMRIQKEQYLLTMATGNVWPPIA